jgi:hypothetical protein
MSDGGRTPEELETLTEDAVVLRDGEALAHLFEDGGVLVTGAGHREARGYEAIARAASQVWDRPGGYIAGVRRVFQSHDTALILGEGAINVSRRGPDRLWRFAIAVLGPVGGDLAGEHQPVASASGNPTNTGSS